MASRYPKAKPLTIGQQKLCMKRWFPDFECTWKNGVCTWVGAIQPTSVSETYQILVRYSQSGSPEVWVISPELVNRPDGERIPHVYPGNRLCLYLPRNKEWDRTMFIAETTIPWAALWLYYYEMWHATGEWLGGGVHPRFNEKQAKVGRRLR